MNQTRRGAGPVDGQNGNYRPRTAGERNSYPQAGDNQVRDWQRNTWYGPAPVNSNPFDEPEDAPELKASRSENVNQHVGSFWEPQGTGYQPQVGQEQAGAAKPAAKRRKAGKRQGHIRILAGVFIFLLAAAIVLRFAVFTVREIQVIGNDRIPAAEIIRVSGIRQGDFILTLNEKAVEQRIISDYRLQFRYMARQMPGRVILSVREREACCWLNYCGIMYVMDKNRMVLYESENPADQPLNLVEVKGLAVRSNTVEGQYISLGSEVQQSIFSELFLEMKVLGCTGEIREADISNPESILLATRDGYTVGLGGRENIHAKLRALILVRNELNGMGYTGGTINVTDPEQPIFTP